MSMYQPQKKHKAQHGNYAKKPSQRQIGGLMDLYSGIQGVSAKLSDQKEKAQLPPGHQFRLKL